MWWRAGTAAILIAAGLVACSTDDLIDLDVPLGIEDGASKGSEKSIKVDGSAGVTLMLDTGASLSVPKGAVDREVVLKVARPSDEKAVELVKSLKSVESIASAPYVLTPHGTQFKNVVTLELPVLKNTDRELAVAWLEDEDDRQWKVLAHAEVHDAKVAVQLKHFSVVVVLDAHAAGLDASVPDGEDDAGDALDSGVPADAGPSSDAAVQRDDATAPDGGASRTDAGAQGGADAGAGLGDAGTGGSDPDAYVPDYDAEVPPDEEEDAYVPDYDAYVPDYDAYVPDYDADAPDYDAYVPDYDAYVPVPPSYDAGSTGA